MFKKITAFVFISLIFYACQNAEVCKDNCSQKEKTVIMVNEGTTLSCKLTAPELQKRKETILSELRKSVLEKKELVNGYSFKFSGTDANIDLLTDFIKSERQCCDFFSFALRMHNSETAWLDITGPEGAKEFIKTELEL